MDVETLNDLAATLYQAARSAVSTVITCDLIERI
jgi:hypothetical protein